MAPSLTLNQAAQPIAEINTTPLIDVMLVLLIMFVITIPVASHDLSIDLPSGTDPQHLPIRAVNRITLGSDATPRWNGAPLTLDQLSAVLAASQRMQPEPELQLAPDAQAPYGTAAEVLRRIKAAQISNFGFVGNERFSSFGKPQKR